VPIRPVAASIRPVVALAVLVVLGLGACGSSGPTPSAPPATPAASTPSGAPVSPGDSWLTATVAQPSEVTDAPTLPPNYQCHPCHFQAENDLIGVGVAPGGLIAVGIQSPPGAATAFMSGDGTRWTLLEGLRAVDQSAATAIASNGTTTVIVGRDHDGATAWASGDRGTTWTPAPAQATLAVPYAAGGMTSVAVLGTGFVAGGYRDDPLNATRQAGVWRSDDGLTWALDDGGGAFSGGRIWGIAVSSGAPGSGGGNEDGSGPTIVAVGTAGDPNYGPAAAWRWTPASGWQRARIQPDDGGAMRAVIATSTGFLAVGLGSGDEGAMSWTSIDGATWTAAPDQPAFHRFTNPVRMQSIAITPGGFTAGGWRSDEAKGSAVIWASTDAIHWTSTWQTSFSGGEVDGVAVVAGRVVAVGRTGYPDWNTATVWYRRDP
jgi:hypothetical protein